MTLSLKAMNLDLKMTVRVCLQMHQTLMFMPTTKAVKKHIATKCQNFVSQQSWNENLEFSSGEAKKECQCPGSVEQNVLTPELRQMCKLLLSKEC